MVRKAIRREEEDLPLLREYDDLIQEILVRLPLVSLLRFKSVCKSWRTLIESPSFFHLLHTTTSRFGSFIVHATGMVGRVERTMENAVLMLSSSVVSESESDDYVSSTEGRSHCVRRRSYRVADIDEKVFKLDDDNLGSSSYDVDHHLVLFKLDNFGFPSCYNFCKFRPIHMVGSCNGLICIRDSDRRDVSLWNPTTKQFRILPKPSITYEDDCLVAFGGGFFYDAETTQEEDYKVVQVNVVRLVEPPPIRCFCRVEVYSLSTDSWRVLKGDYMLPGDPIPSSGLLYLNGRMLFMANFILSSEQCIPLEKNDRFIISFDLSKESFIPIQLPDHIRQQQLFLCCFGEKVALFTSTKRSFAKVDASTGYYQNFHVWVLDEHGFSSGGISVENKYWTKFYRFRIDVKRGTWYIPRGISNDGEFALLETRSLHPAVGKQMTLYNLVTHEVRKEFLYCAEVSSNAFAYKPSLVSIRGGGIVKLAADRVIGKAAAEMDSKSGGSISTSSYGGDSGGTSIQPKISSSSNSGGSS